MQGSRGGRPAGSLADAAFDESIACPFFFVERDTRETLCQIEVDRTYAHRACIRIGGSRVDILDSLAYRALASSAGSLKPNYFKRRQDLREQGEQLFRIREGRERTPRARGGPVQRQSGQGFLSLPGPEAATGQVSLPTQSPK